MQRSIFDYMGNIYKNNCKVDFSEYLDIKEFCTCTNGFYFKPMDMAEASNWKDSLDIRIDQINASFSSSNDTSSSSAHEEDIKESNLAEQTTHRNSFKDYIYLYRLNAVVLHYGSHDSGHFVTYRRFHKKYFKSMNEP